MIWLVPEINDLNLKLKDFSYNELFMVILFDKMTIQENLVLSKHTVDLIGFVNLSDPNLNYTTLDKRRNSIKCFSIFNKYCQSV